MKSKLGLTVVSMLAFATCAQAAQKPAADAASYPSRPIRILVPQGPSGSNDIMARYIGGQLAERLGRPVVVDNRPGAEGMIATEIVARAAPDGYTLLMASTAFTQNPAVVKKLPYDPIRDFDWVAIFGRAPVVITVGPSLPVGSLKELIALGRAKPNYITIASAGGFMHFVSAMFRSHAKIDATIALYKGGAPALTDVTGGHAHMGAATVVTAAPFIRSGRLKPLAVGGTKRVASLPEVPTAIEAGLPSYDAAIWWGWATAAHTPAAIVNKLNTEIATILKLPETAKRFALEDAEVEPPMTPAEIRKMIATDLAKWEKVARDAGMQKQ
jgi:tripartite-type tricarboxylate transporter receptor subunit TctC